MELTSEELARVRAAIQDGRAAEVHGPQYRRILHDSSSLNLRRLATLWSEMREDERDLIRFGLAEKAGVADPWALDVGTVASEYVAMFKGVRGEAVQVPGLRAAVKILWQIWREAGNSPRLGKLDRPMYDDEPKTAYPACSFVARQLLILFPEHFARTKDATQRKRAAEIKADSQLRELVSRERQARKARQKAPQ